MICYLDQIINEFIGRGGRGGRSSVILPLLDFFVRDAQSDNARMIFGGTGKEQYFAFSLSQSHSATGCLLPSSTPEGGVQVACNMKCSLLRNRGFKMFTECSQNVHKMFTKCSKF